MSPAYGHVATPIQPTEMDVTSAQRIHNGDPNKPPNAEAIASKGIGNQRHRNKQNLDYVLRTGLAGGFAGCVVRIPPVELRKLTL